MFVNPNLQNGDSQCPSDLHFHILPSNNPTTPALLLAASKDMKVPDTLLAVFCVGITHLSKILKARAYEGNLVILSNLNLLLHRAQQLGSELIDVQNVAEDHIKVLGRMYAMSIKLACKHDNKLKKRRQIYVWCHFECNTMKYRHPTMTQGKTSLDMINTMEHDYVDLCCTTTTREQKYHYITRCNCSRETEPNTERDSKRVRQAGRQ